MSAALPRRGRRRAARAAVAGLAFAAACALPSAHAGLDAAARVRVAELRAQAQRHEHGEGTPRNPARAVQLYCEAARDGDAEAQFSLGWMFANGRGVPRDDASAALFFGMAAAQGHPTAQNMLRRVGDPALDVPECLRDPEFPSLDERGAGFAEDVGPPTRDQARVMQIVDELAPQFRVNPEFVLAIIRTESNFNATVVSNRNAQGLMQLIPETAERFNVAKPFDPVQNIRGGLAYLRWLFAYFRGDVALVAAAYNAGEGAVNKYRGVPPFAETQAYVDRIRELYRRSSHPFDPKAADPSPDLARIRANAAS
jgi:TPR repeat protein